MSSKSVDKKFVEVENKEEDFLDLKRIIIPFSSLFSKDEKFIYDGTEKLPFSRRDPLYKVILLQEFRGCFKAFLDKY
jgi:hypothetical protein